MKGTHWIQEADIVSSDGFSDDSPPDDSSDELDSNDIVAYDMEMSHYTTLANWTRREKRDFRWLIKEIEGLGNRDTNPHWPYHCLEIARKRMLSHMWTGACRSQALIDHRIPARRLRDLVMEALKGPPKSDALAEYNQGDKSLKDILGVLDKVYGGQTSYIALQSELCNM